MMHVDIRGQVGFLVEQIGARMQHLEAIGYFCAQEIASMDDEKARLESQLEELEEADKFCKTWKSDLAQRKGDLSSLRDVVSARRSKLPAAIVDRIGFPSSAVGLGGGAFPNAFPHGYRHFNTSPDMSAFNYGQAQYPVNSQFPFGQYPSFPQSQYPTLNYPVPSFPSSRSSEFPHGRRNVSDPFSLSKDKVSMPASPALPTLNKPVGEQHKGEPPMDSADRVEKQTAEANLPTEPDGEEDESSDDELLSFDKMKQRAGQRDESGGPREEEEGSDVEMLE
jgi:hypothetical protein